MVKWVKRVFLSLTPQTHYNVPKKHYNARVNVIPSVLICCKSWSECTCCSWTSTSWFCYEKENQKIVIYKTCQNCPLKVKEKKTLLASDKMPRLVVDRINNKILVNKN